MSAKSSAVHPLVSAHADAIAKYDSATTAGVKAGAARKIATLELDMTLEGVAFESWTRPATVRTSAGPRLTDTEVRSQLTALQGVVGDSNVAESIRATADQRMRRLLKTYAESYGIDPAEYGVKVEG